MSPSELRRTPKASRKRTGYESEISSKDCSRIGRTLAKTSRAPTLSVKTQIGREPFRSQCGQGGGRGAGRSKRALARRHGMSIMSSCYLTARVGSEPCLNALSPIAEFQQSWDPAGLRSKCQVPISDTDIRLPTFCRRNRANEARSWALNVRAPGDSRRRTGCPIRVPATVRAHVNRIVGFGEACSRRG